MLLAEGRACMCWEREVKEYRCNAEVAEAVLCAPPGDGGRQNSGWMSFKELDNWEAMVVFQPSFFYGGGVSWRG
jgi:hypothetical protein